VTDKEFASELRVARAVNRWNQKTLAKKCGVSATYISLLETGKRSPSWSFVNRFAKIAGLVIRFDLKRPRRVR
jgi:transcriptional regulator with XRE-family HTH domain